MQTTKALFIVATFGAAYVIAFANNPKELTFETIVDGHYGEAVGELGRRAIDHEVVVPTAIALADNGDIYVADVLNNRIAIFRQNKGPNRTIALKIGKKRFADIIDDLAIDVSGDLYVALAHEAELLKFPKDKLTAQRTSLKNLPIRWDARLDSWKQGVPQIEHLIVDSNENAYLKGFDELIKIDRTGKVKERWGSILPGRSFFLAPDGGLFFIRKGNVAHYDVSGKFVSETKCGEGRSVATNGQCRLPIWADDVRAFYVGEKANALLIKTKDGKQIERVLDFAIDFESNVVKFDKHGNAFVLRFMDSGFRIEKVIL